MKFDSELDQSILIPDDNGFKEQRDFMNKSILLCDQAQIQLNFKNTMELDEDVEEKDKQVANIVKKVFNKDTTLYDSFEEVNDFEENYYFKLTQKPRREKQKIFLIEKDKEKQAKKGKRKRGRLSKNKIPSYRLKHGKFSKDDIIQKIKRHFINNLLKYINELYNRDKHKKRKKIKPLLISINPGKYNVYSNRNNQEFFNQTLEDFFSAEISIKNITILKTHSQDYNKKKIDSLKKENKYKEIIKILSLTVKEMYEKYISNELDEFNLEKDLVVIEDKDGIEYKNIYKEIAKELTYLFNKKAEKIKKK